MLARPFANSGSASNEYDCSRLNDSWDWDIFVEVVVETIRIDTAAELECGGGAEGNGRGSDDARSQMASCGHMGYIFMKRSPGDMRMVY